MDKVRPSGADEGLSDEELLIEKAKMIAYGGLERALEAVGA